MNKRKIIGIDLGTKRTGIAISDIDQNFAFPVQVITVNSIKSEFQKVIQGILDIAEKENVGEVVIGESKTFAGAENPIMEWVKKISVDLREKGYVISVIPEFMTSAEASRYQGENKLIDASAATIILQNYLDKKKNQNNIANDKESVEGN